MTTLKNLIGKTCDISLLKGITHESFSKQNKISKIVAKNFLKAKKKDKIKTSQGTVGIITKIGSVIHAKKHTTQ